MSGTVIEWNKLYEVRKSVLPESDWTFKLVRKTGDVREAVAFIRKTGETVLTDAYMIGIDTGWLTELYRVEEQHRES